MTPVKKKKKMRTSFASRVEQRADRVSKARKEMLDAVEKLAAVLEPFGSYERELVLKFVDAKIEMAEAATWRIVRPRRRKRWVR